MDEPHAYKSRGGVEKPVLSEDMLYRNL